MEKEISAKGKPADAVQKNIDTILRQENEAVQNPPLPCLPKSLVRSGIRLKYN